MKRNRIRKILTLFLSLMMLVMILPAPVKAATLTVGTGGTYATLAAALSVATNGDKITLLSDVVETSNYTFDTTGKTVNIDGGGHKVTSMDSTTETVYALKVTGSGTLVLKNVTFQGGTLNIQSGSTDFYSIGIWTELNSAGRVLSIGTVSAIGGNIDLSNVNFYEIFTIGLYNTGEGVVDLTSAIGANVDSTTAGTFITQSTYGLYNTGTGTINIDSATSGSLVNEKWFGQTAGALSTSGVVNAMNVTGGDITNGNIPMGYGIHLNFSGIDSTIFNATNVSAGYSSNISFRVIINRGTVNVENIIQTVNFGSDFAIYNNLGTANVGTFPLITVTDNQNVKYNQNATSTLTLNSNGGSCVLPYITVAKTGSTNIGILPSVFKDGVEGKWYTDSALTTLFTGNTVNGETTLFAGGWPVTTITDIPASYSMNNGSKVIFNPQPTGGTWEWDHEFFSATFNSPATFTALKSGTSTITYTVDGVSQEINISVLPISVTPQTGENMIWVYGAWIIVAVSAVTVVSVVRRKVKN